MLILLSILLLAVALYVHSLIRIRRAEAAYPPQGAYVTVDGIRLHYVRRGKGPTIVLLHGSSGSVYDYTLSFLDQAAQHYDVVAFDRPGFGYSELPREPSTVFVQARLIHEALHQLGIERPILVGHSWSGWLIFALALQYPGEYAALVHYAGAAYGGGGMPMMGMLYRLARIPLVGHFLLTLSPLYGAMIPPTLRLAFYPQPILPDYRASVYAVWLRPNSTLAFVQDWVPQTLGAAVKQLIPRYGEIKLPVVMIVGEQDREVGLYNVTCLRSVLPNHVLITVPDGGHELHFSHPRRLLEAFQTAWELAAQSMLPGKGSR